MMGSGESGRVVAGLSVISFFVMMGYTLITPILPLYALSFNVGETLAGLLVSVYAAARVLFSIPGGVLAAKHEPKKVMLFGLLLIIAASTVNAFAPSYAVLFSGRFLEGVGSALYVTTAFTIIGESVPSERRGRAVSLYFSSTLVGTALGPSVGGFAAELWGFSAPFLLYALMVSVGVLWTRFRVDTASLHLNRLTNQSVSKPKTPMLKGITTLLGSRPYLLVSLAAATSFLSRFGVRAALVPLYAHSNLSMSESAIGGVLTVSSLAALATMYPAGWLSDRYGRKPIFAASSLISTLIVLLIPLYESHTAFWVLMALLGATIGLTGPLVAWVADLTPAALMGASMGLSRTVNNLGFFAGPLLLGFLADISKTDVIEPLPFQAASLILLTSCLTAIWAKDPRATKGT